MPSFSRQKQAPITDQLTSAAIDPSHVPAEFDGSKASKRREAADRKGAEQIEVRIGDVLVHRAPPTVARSLRYLLAGDAVPHRLGVTSSIHGEGVTSISRSLAALIASDWRLSTCWVDLNWWKPGRPSFEADLYDVTISDVVQGHTMVVDLPIESSIAGLSFVSAGEIPLSSRAQTTRSDELHSLVHVLSERFDYVVFDLPPILATSDAVTLSGMTDGFLLVVRQEAASSVQVQAALKAVTLAPCLGTVLNGAESNVPKSLRTSNEVWALGT